MTSIFQQKSEGPSRLGRVFLLLALCSFFLFPSTLRAADERAGNIPPEAQAALDAILAAKDPNGPPPSLATIHAFLDYAMSPLSPSPDGKEVYPAERSDEGQGIYWRTTLKVPLATALRYLYDPKLPQEVVYPASIRRQHWLPGSAILGLPSGIWNELGKHKDKPLVLRGTEEEEIAPDTFSGSYYRYTSDRMLILTEFEGRQALLTITWQKDKSEVGKKAATIGDPQNWDFVYSGAPGMLTKGIGWADTDMYASSAVMVLYEDAPGGKNTGYALFKWLRAGWAGMNMVKRHHIRDGASRSFDGLKTFLQSPKRPAADDIVAYTEKLRAMDVEALRKKFAPYAVKVSEAATSNDALKTDDFQKVIKDGSYGANLAKSDLISILVINYIKDKMGKPVLASTF